MTTLGNGRMARTPSGLKVAAMSYDKLEDIAERFRPLLPKTAGANGGPWHIDARRLLEHMLPTAGFKYHVVESEHLEEVAAFTIPDESLIVVRQDVYDGLFEEDVFSRSTIVHEFSHIALRHAATLHRGAVAGEHQFCEDSEWQAKSLTAALMMPIDACKAATSVQHLAELCGTSSRAAGYRIDKLIERRRLDANRNAGTLFFNHNERKGAI